MVRAHADAVEDSDRRFWSRMVLVIVVTTILVIGLWIGANVLQSHVDQHGMCGYVPMGTVRVWQCPTETSGQPTRP